jgi:hypothetical protein
MFCTRICCLNTSCHHSTFKCQWRRLIDIPVLSGSAIMTSTPACASLNLQPTEPYFLLSSSINGSTGCLVVDPCNIEFPMGFQGLSVNAFSPDAPTSLAVPLDNAHLSLTGTLTKRVFNSVTGAYDVVSHARSSGAPCAGFVGCSCLCQDPFM